ncbi:glucosaminidase domain-containing protein [Ochrobactrum sp. MYb379]|uniref:glucosaminidase domain-containing protein n=2 Tax=Ochrobactrum sp. MYb379 TaxID=2745275 RepID=UPI0030A8D9FA
MVGFIFGGDTGETPESVKRKRAIAMALLGQSHAPRNVGEGLNALGDGIVANVMNRRVGEAEKAGQASAEKAFGGIDFSSLFGGGASAPAYPSSVAAGASPTSGAATGTETVNLSGDKQKFIDTLLPAAIEHGERIGVDPRIIVAQAAQETGWGKSAPGNNFFGIKSHGQSGGQNLTTHEVINGQRVKINDSFRTFASPQDSVAGYADFLSTNKRYRPMREAQGLDAQLQALGASGYATDPNYSRSVGAIARAIDIPQQQQRGVQVASLDPSIGLDMGQGANPSPLQTMPNRIDPNNPVDPSQAAQPMPDTMSDAQIDPRQALQPMVNQPQPTPAKVPYDFTGNPQLSAGAGMPFQAGQAQPQQMASVQQQQQADPKTAIRDALLRQNDMALGGALAPQGQAPQQVADATGTFPPAPTGQPFSGQQGGDARQAIVQKLMQAAQNPWMNDNQRAMVNALLQNQMQQADPLNQLKMQKAQLEVDALRAKPQTEYGFTTLPDGTVLRTDKRSGNAEPIYSAGQKPTGDMQEYEFAKSQGYQGTFADYQQSMKKAGASSTSVTVGEGDKFYEALDKKNADTFAALSDTGIQARSKLAQIERLGGLMEASPSGASAALKLAAGEYGIKTDGLDDLQASQALINELVPQQRQPGSGPMSDADLALFKQSLPRIINTPDGNNLILDTMRGITQYQIQMGDIADRVANRDLSAAEARNEIKNLKNPLEGFRTSSKEQGSKNTSTGVQWSID